MSHEVETMAYAFDSASTDFAYQVPWHGLGVKVHKDMSPQDMMIKAGIDWSVERHPMFMEIDGQNIPTGLDAIVRNTDKKFFTHATPTWNEFQNDEVVDTFTEFVTEGSMEMNTLGALQDGSKIFALAKIKKDFSLFRGKDVVQSFMLLTFSHKYGTSLKAMFTPTRVVCANTLAVALGNRSDIAIRVNHSQRFNKADVLDALGIAETNMETYHEAAEFLAGKKFTVDNLKEYYKEVFPSSKKDKVAPSRNAEKALEFINTQPGAELGEGTWWSAFNAATFMVDHEIGRTDETRLNSAWYGPGRNTKNVALKKAVEYAEAA
jgi:phage/plasmid-like protein (TIGR03299 family)